VLRNRPEINADNRLLNGQVTKEINGSLKVTEKQAGSDKRVVNAYSGIAQNLNKNS